MKQLFFVKPPIQGTVKTRLARYTGPALATEIYGSIMESVIGRFSSGSCCLYVAGEDKEGFFQSRFPEIPRFQQSGENLGLRMGLALLESANRWPSESLLLTGSDIPAYHPDIAALAAEKLQYSDAVLIPSTDGGYTTIGIRGGLIDASRLPANDPAPVNPASGATSDLPAGGATSDHVTNGVGPDQPGIGARPDQTGDTRSSARTLSSDEFLDFFRQIPWSTSSVLEIQKQKLESIGLSVSVMEPLEDLDDARDLYSLFRKGLLPQKSATLVRELPRIALVLPVYNEVENLDYVLTPLMQAGFFRYIVCADNNSTDGSADKARQLGAMVSHCSRRGYGSTCLAGMDLLDGYADWDILLYMDADGSDDPADLESVLGPVVSGEADFCIGARTTGVLLPHQKFGNWLATFLIRLLYGYSYMDLGPFRAIRRGPLNKLRMDDPDFGWTVQMQIRALKHRLSITEVPVMSRKRYAGRSKVSATIRGSVLAGWVILRTVFREFLLNKKESGV